LPPELYKSLAIFYDKIYHWKDYEKEAKILKKLVLKYRKSSGNLLLDVGCGTGEHIKFFSQLGFECAGVDSSKEMISVARAKLVGTKFIVGSMTDFDLDNRFDVVTCLFGAFGYLKTQPQIEKAVSNISRHLKAGGILIIEPWLTKKELSNDAIHLQTYEDTSLKIARVNSVRMKGNFTVIDDRYLIAEGEKGVSYLKDTNQLRFFDSKELEGVLEKEDLKLIGTTERLQPDRQLIISIKGGI